MHLLTDCSVSPHVRFGIGGYLCIENFEEPVEKLIESIQLKSFEGVTSTELELKTLIWALNDFKMPPKNLFVYTDSQNIAGLLKRRNRLEENDFRNNLGGVLKHAKIYKAFYRLIDELKFEVIKVKGHSKSNDQSEEERIFSLLDRCTRKELREQLAM